VKPLFIVFVGGLKKNNGSRKTIDAGAIVEIGFAQGPQKLNDGSGKTNYPGRIDKGFTVFDKLFHPESCSGSYMLQKCSYIA
jgi:hypothetical protein